MEWIISHRVSLIDWISENPLNFDGLFSITCAFTRICWHDESDLHMQIIHNFDVPNLFDRWTVCFDHSKKSNQVFYLYWFERELLLACFEWAIVFVVVFLNINSPDGFSAQNICDSFSLGGIFRTLPWFFFVLKIFWESNCPYYPVLNLARNCSQQLLRCTSWILNQICPLEVWFVFLCWILHDIDRIFLSWISLKSSHGFQH